MYGPRPKNRTRASLPWLEPHLPRLDDSPGVCLRRSVLLRNAMLSSLEQERLQQTADATAPADPEPAVSEELAQEAAWFDDLLSELTGQISCQDSHHSCTAEETGAGVSPVLECHDDDDFVRLDHTENNIGDTHIDCSFGICSQANPTSTGVSRRTQFTEALCTGYPNVCPYPSVSSLEIVSSEELPALVHDDSDFEDDDDDREDRAHEDQLITSPTLGPKLENASNLCPLSPIYAESRHAAAFDAQGFQDLFSPESSRPVSPVSSASSKGDADHTPSSEAQHMCTLPPCSYSPSPSHQKQSIMHVVNRFDVDSILKRSSAPGPCRQKTPALDGHRVSSYNRLYQPSKGLVDDLFRGPTCSGSGSCLTSSQYAHHTCLENNISSNNNIVLHWSPCHSAR